jgi:hypothetical protein
MIIGFVGLIGSGKDTAADYLVNFHGFRRDSFATTLKDAVSAVFGWDRLMLEGRTAESRAWREQVDTWWAQRLNMPHLTPRWILQHWGTDVLRNHFNDDIWIASLEHKLQRSTDNVVISDVRFPNEIKAIRRAGGYIYWIQRGELPPWYECALTENTTDKYDQWLLQDAHKLMEQSWPQVHNSEWAWVGQSFDAVIDNNHSVDELYDQLKNLVQDHRVAMADLAA